MYIYIQRASVIYEYLNNYYMEFLIPQQSSKPGVGNWRKKGLLLNVQCATMNFNSLFQSLQTFFFVTEGSPFSSPKSKFISSPNSIIIDSSV